MSDIRPLTVAMTPSFYDPDHMLLRTQLRCLSTQTCDDFGVILVDPHYRKRRLVVPELAEIYNLAITHVPYEPSTNVAKVLDCAIFNAAYCYSRSPRIVRYSCYRFVTPDFVEQLMTAPPLVNADMYSFNVGPCMLEERERQAGNMVEHRKHEIVWNFESDEVNWDAIPDRPGVDIQGNYLGDPSLSLARWGPLSEIEMGVGPVPLNCYGNIMWWRENWLDLNGTEEVITNTAHWEDIDFDTRANLSGQQAVRIPRLMYRLYHQHGGFSQRSNVEVDVPCKSPCERCRNFRHYADRMNDRELRYQMYMERHSTFREIDLYEDSTVWVCKACGLSGPIWRGDESTYTNYLRDTNKTRATILPDKKIGRNLRVLSEDMDRCDTVADKFEVYQRSWTDDRYYVR